MSTVDPKAAEPLLAAYFASEWYIQHYPDVAAAKVDPWQHYCQFGRAEGRYPCALPALELEQQLWHAAQPEAIAQALTQLFADARPLHAALAAWVLARWYGSFGQWQQLVPLLPCLLNEQAALLVIQHQGPFLLAFSAYLHTGDLASASALLTHPAWPASADKQLARSMLCDGSKKLAALNHIFRDHGLRTLQLTTAAQLDSLACQGQAQRRPRWLQPLISVIVPCYNAEQTLSTALRSLLAQSHTNIEILVADDASTDGSVQLLSTFAASDKRVRLIQLPFNQGAYAARNAALAVARGEYITTHDADDWSHPQKLERQLQALRSDKQAVASMSSWVRCSPDLQFQRWRMEEGWIYPNVSSLLFHRKVLTAIGYWDRVAVNADTEYCYRLRCYFGDNAIAPVLADLPLAFGRADARSLSQTSATHLRTQFLGVRKDYQQAAIAWQQSAAKTELYLPAEPLHRPFAVPVAICRGTPAQQQHNLQLLLAASGVFDENWYLTRYPDVAQSGLDPALHFIAHGAAEGRDPGPAFSFSGYCYQQQVSQQQGQQQQGPAAAEGLATLLSQRHIDGLQPIQGQLAWQPGAATLICLGHQVAAGQFGAERSLLDVLQAMAGLNANIVVVLPGASCADYLDLVRQHCQQLLIIPYSWWHADRPLQQQTVEVFQQLIRQYQPCLFYVNTLVLAEPLLAARQLQVPVVVHVRELPEHDTDLCELLGADPAQIRQHVLALADHFIANSAVVAAYLAVPDRCSIIANSIDTADFPYTPLPLQARLQVVMLSSNLPKKGLYDVQALAALCLAQQIAADFLLYGPENQYTEFMQQQGVPENLRFCGYVEQPQQALAQADLVLNVSHFQESFGRSVLEALASGRPVLCYDWGALAEWVNTDCGILVPFADVAALARHLNELCLQRERLTRMGIAGRQYVAQQFNPARFAQQLQQQLSQISAKVIA